MKTREKDIDIYVLELKGREASPLPFLPPSLIHPPGVSFDSPPYMFISFFCEEVEFYACSLVGLAYSKTCIWFSVSLCLVFFFLFFQILRYTHIFLLCPSLLPDLPVLRHSRPPLSPPPTWHTSPSPPSPHPYY